MVWTPNGREAVYVQSDSVVVAAGSSAQILRQDIETGRVVERRLSPEHATVIDVSGDSRLVFDTRSPRQNLRTITMTSTGASSPAWVSRGGIVDRPPAYSPDGRFVLYRQSPAAGSVRLVAVRADDGMPAPFETYVPIIKPTEVALGRPRWMPDSRRILFLGQDEHGVTGVYVQDFTPGRDTIASRRRFGAFDPENVTESFDISPDGTQLLAAAWEQLFSVMEAFPVPGILVRPRGRATE